MRTITAAEAAEKWGISLRRVQDYCKSGKIQRAQKFGHNWMIPEDEPRPVDRRQKDAKQKERQGRPLIRKSPYLYMTDLYKEEGSADRCVEELYHHPEAQALFSAEIAYSRGEIDKVYEYANYFLHSHSGFYAVISGGMLLAQCAIWKGDINMWNKAKMHLLEAPCKNEIDRDIISLALSATDIAIRDTENFPEWFARGSFNNLPKDSHPAARVYYIKYLMIAAQEIATGKVNLSWINGLGLMRVLPYISEPMISQMVADKIIIAEAYLRILTAIAYHQTGDDKQATEHLNKAIRICLADRLYAPLVEYRRQLGIFLDDRLAAIDANALKTVKEMHKHYHKGWTALHNAVLRKTVSADLSGREREVARLAAFGLSDGQIAKQLFISESSVKSLIRSAKNKTGANRRYEFINFI